MTSAVRSEVNERKLTGWHVLGIMFGFFAIMFAVNGVFLYHAITSFPGEDTKKSYLQGLNYNARIEARAQQAELGWTAQAGLHDGTLIFDLRDADNTPLMDFDVVGQLRRATTQDADIDVQFEPDMRGVYTAPAAALSPGRWQLKIAVKAPASETVIFEAEKNLYLP